MGQSLHNMVDQVASECVGVRVRMLNRVVTNIYDDALRPLDLKASQMNILVAAAKMGVAKPADLCNSLHLDVSTLSRNVDRMKSRGWIETVPGEDARSQPFRLTTAGRNVLEKAMPAWSSAQRKIKDMLGESIVQQLNLVLKRMSAV